MKAQQNHHHCCSSGTLPEDIIISEILPRLPPRSLLNFRSASKFWCTLISSPSFACKYLDSARIRLPHLIVVTLDINRREEICFYAYDLGSRSNTASFLFSERLTQDQEGLHPPQHCNGLVLLRTTTQLHVCNPSTREFVTLPNESQDADIHGIYSRMAGIGFIPGINAYKVARYLYPSIHLEGNFEVLTIGEDSSWRVISEDPPYPICIESPPMPAGESIYFKIDKNFGSSLPTAFICFNLREEKFHLVYPPSSALTDYDNMSIVDLDGNPCFVYCSSDQTRYDLWISRQHGSNHVWNHSFCISLEQPEGYVLPIVVREGKILLSKHTYPEGLGRLEFYDPQSKSFELVIDVDRDLAYQREHGVRCSLKNSLHEMMCYVESIWLKF